MSDETNAELAARLALAEEERSRALHALEHALQLLGRVRGLVSRAFAEGFEARDPNEREPWLVDWLQSRSKAELDQLFARKPPDEPPISPDATG